MLDEVEELFVAPLPPAKRNLSVIKIQDALADASYFCLMNNLDLGGCHSKLVALHEILYDIGNWT